MELEKKFLNVEAAGEDGVVVTRKLSWSCPGVSAEDPFHDEVRASLLRPGPGQDFGTLIA